MPNANSTVPMPTSPPSDEADAERGQLDDRAHEPQRMPSAATAVIETVARTRTEAGADVERHAERGDDDAAEQHRPPHREVVRPRGAR